MDVDGWAHIVNYDTMYRKFEKEVKTKEDKADIEKAVRELQEETQKAGEALYNKGNEEKKEEDKGSDGAEEVKEE